MNQWYLITRAAYNPPESVSIVVSVIFVCVIVYFVLKRRFGEKKGDDLQV